jgi:hypothetical protein
MVTFSKDKGGKSANIIKEGYYGLLFGLVFILGIHPFLSLNHPVKADVLIVEGWIPEDSIKFAVQEFHKNHYDFILTNGGQIDPKSTVNTGDEYAELTKEHLMEWGIDGNHIHAVKTPKINQSRTYSFALDTIEWLTKHRKSIKAVNVLTLGPHARKSYVLYKKAADKKINVGVISTPPVDYDPSYWYFSVKGIHFVFKDLVGYLYALIL